MQLQSKNALSLGGRGYKAKHRPSPVFHWQSREQVPVNNHHHHQGHTTHSYCPVDSISSVVHTLIHAQAKETRNLWGRPAKQYCSEKNDHGIHHEFDSVYVSGTGLHPLQIRLIPYAWCACNLSNSHHLLKKREVQRGKQTAPGPHISGGGRTPVEVHWVAKHDIACDV